MLLLNSQYLFPAWFLLCNYKCNYNFVVTSRLQNESYNILYLNMEPLYPAYVTKYVEYQYCSTMRKQKHFFIQVLIFKIEGYNTFCLVISLHHNGCKIEYFSTYILLMGSTFTKLCHGSLRRKVTNG